jgi:hypothetical protein
MSEDDDSTTSVKTAENAETKLSEDELKAWKADFENPKALAEAIVRQMKEKNKNLKKDHQQFKFSSTLAIFGCAKDDMHKFQSLYGKHYRWKYKYENAMEDEKGAKPVKLHLAEIEKKITLQNILPRGWKFVLEIWIGKKWLEWLYVSKSTLKSAGLGLFTTREFPVGSVIGYYVGPVVYQGDEAGGERPRTAELVKAGVVPTPYSITLRDKNGYWRVVSPEPVRPEEDASLLFGLHYMNNACETYTNEAKTSQKKGTKFQNCELVEDGSVQTIKKVSKGDELFAPYKRSQARNNKSLECAANDDESDDAERTVSEDREPTAVENAVDTGRAKRVCKGKNGSVETRKRLRKGKEPSAASKKKATRKIGNRESGAKEVERDEDDDGTGSEDRKREAVESAVDDGKVKKVRKGVHGSIDSKKKLIKGMKPVAYVKKIAARKNAFDKFGAKEVDNDDEESTGRKPKAAEIGDDHGKVKKAGEGEDGNKIASSLVAYATASFDCEVASEEPTGGKRKKRTLI